MTANNNHQSKGSIVESESRRAVLKRAGVTGGLLFAGPVAAAAQAADDEVQIVTHRSANGIEKTAAVPRSWKNHFDRVVQARRNVGERLRGTGGIETISIVGSEEDFGGMPGFEIKIEARSEAQSLVPDHAEGVGIRTTEPVETRLQSCSINSCYNNGDYDDTPGGALFDGATAGSQYYLDYNNDGQYEQLMLTANHVIDIDHCGPTPTEGQTVYQYCDHWGECVKGDRALDVAGCEPDSGMGVENYIQDGWYNPTVMGFVTEYGLGNMKSNNHTVHNMGINTGFDSGSIDELSVGDYGCTGFNNNGVRSTLSSSSGDSGCPVYDLDGGDAYIINIHSQGVGSSNQTDCLGQEITPKGQGTAAYELNNQWNGQWVAPI